ncbi:SWI/SNF complex component SNF12 homolog [Selaginella moellendorffii]|uniref:SWI/SNF complex component SNF12 homolog n=1 Tax=Selaginella moellendorffii TaxID=88036 RepID=UPI000D1C2F3E|nr:SWI/SNF complex component SNF12 homolog [Selaginella moellendorffii]|eukprot:XP_024519405.1 SWI/SNF complex component SNF12 homolog [Selaginella moellendorffii]
MAAGQPGAGAGQPSSSATPAAMIQQLQQGQQQQQQQSQHLAAQMQMAMAAAAAGRNGGMLNSAAGPLQQQLLKQRLAVGGVGGGGGVQGSAGGMIKPQPHQIHQMQMIQMQMLQQQQQQQRLAAAATAAAAIKSGEANPAARRKRRKIGDRQIPDRVGALLPESALYSQLLEFEGRVDAALARKKLEIQESVQNPPRYQRTLRMYVFNTYANQVNNHDPHMGYNPGEPPSWTLRIMGRIVGDDGETESAAAKSLPFPKFSSFFKRITVQLDPAMYPENSTIVWDASRSTGNNSGGIISSNGSGGGGGSAPVEGFEIKRKGDKELTAIIRLDMKYTPERYKLSPPLAELLGVEVETRARIIAAFWHYIKGKKLQNPSDPTVVNCDLPLQRILGEDRVKFTSILNRLHQHLSAPQPIQLEHKIKLSGKNPAGNACYDIVVDVVTPLQKDMAMFLANMERHRDIEAYDELICSSIRKINEHRKRRAFFLGFSNSPVEFINGLIASQSRDLKIINGQASRNAEKERRSDFYCQPWVEDAVIRYLNRRTARVAEAAANAAPAAVALATANSSVTPS